jgi:hypothetical protein
MHISRTHSFTSPAIALLVYASTFASPAHSMAQELDEHAAESESSVPALVTEPQRTDGPVAFGDALFELPSPGWVRTERAGASATALVLEKSRPSHVLQIGVEAVDAPPPFGRTELKDRIFGDIQSRPARTGVTNRFSVGERSISGLSYQTLAVQITSQPTGSAIVDGLYAIYFSPDFDDRRRLHVLSWSDAHSVDAPALPLDEFDAFLAHFGARPVGQVLLADDFGDPAAGTFITNSTDPDRFLAGYVDGEYSVQRVQPESTSVFFVSNRMRTFMDAALAIDARLTGDGVGSVIVYCRRSGSPSSGYRLEVDPTGQRFRLLRSDAGTFVTLVPWRPATLQRETNHIELSCAGSTIVVSANGTALATVRDGRYRQGVFGVGVGGPASAYPEARFANLMITQR